MHLSNTAPVDNSPPYKFLTDFVDVLLLPLLKLSDGLQVGR